MTSFAIPEEYVHREKDNFIKYGGVVKRHNVLVEARFLKIKSISTHTYRTNMSHVIYTEQVLTIFLCIKRVRLM